jgi:apolipoprotein N-acyltransferase
MQRPRTSTLIVGHPVVAVPLCVVFAGVAIAGIVHEGFSWPVLLLLALAGGIASTAREASRYRAWTREWDSYNPNYRPPQHLRSAARLAALLLVAAAIYWLVNGYGDPGSPAHVIAPLLMFGVPALGLLRMVLRLRKRRRLSSPDWVVTQAISRLLPAPTVADAYARLPEYLRPIFSSEAEGKETP